VTDSKTAEALERAPVQPGDVILADRYYLRHAGVRFVASAGGAVVVRVRVSAGGMLRRGKTAFDPLTAAKGLRVGEVGEWEVTLVDPRGEEPIRGRLVAVRLPKPVADRNLKRVLRRASKTQKKAGPRAQAGANYVFVFTTLDKSISKESVLELYRARWQIELVFKRLKQLLQLGRLPYKRETTAHGWILAKLVVALLLEKMHRNAMLFSPWGYDLEAALPRSSSEGPS
jgi:hypothetical protein